MKIDTYKYGYFTVSDNTSFDVEPRIYTGDKINELYNNAGYTIEAVTSSSWIASWGPIKYFIDGFYSHMEAQEYADNYLFD